jgi:hypothetical protein
MVLLATGPGRFDATCYSTVSLPHLLIGSNGAKSERVMARGNEKSAVRFNSPYNPTEKLGYPLHPKDKFDFIVDFMNENMQDKTVYLTMTYDFIDGKPPGFSSFRSIWLDIVACGTSEMKPPNESGNYKVSQYWTANLNADILGTGGHLHDGGTHLAITVDDMVVCDSVATYAVSASGGGMGGGPMAAMGRVVSDLSRVIKHNYSDTENLQKRDGPHVANMPHISKMSSCSGPTIGVQKVVKGQKWGIHAYYDYSQHDGMKTAKNKQSSVMGIALLSVKNWSA